jgi:O-succinylbenzoic acid--CoA ligase
VAEIKDYLGHSLDSTAAPRELHVLDELPRRGIGKLDRRALRQRFESGGDLPGGYGW